MCKVQEKSVSDKPYVTIVCIHKSVSSSLSALIHLLQVSISFFCPVCTVL